MDRSNIDDMLRLMGIDLKEGKWRVLEIILSSHEKSGDGLTFAELKAGLEKLEGKPMKRPLIYRYLKDLEQKGIVFVDRTSRNNLYVIDYETTLQSLKTMNSIAIRDLKKEQRTLGTKIDQMSQLSAETLSFEFIELLTGKKAQDKPRIAKGLQEILKLIQDKILIRSSEHDIIRCSIEWSFLAEIMTAHLEELGKLTVAEGVNIHFLINEVSRTELEKFMGSTDTTTLVQIFGKNTRMRISTRTTKTYQGVYLNDHGIVLLVSMEPYAALWIPKQNNTLLIYDVLTKFDKDFSNAENMVQVQ
ncbi:MAG: hypothetical protein ACTSV2_11370 [Candidatus Thorarchaeota archaeon]